MGLAIVACAKEMHTRKYYREFGAGTSILLRLAKPWEGSGRVVVADSAFTSVKSAVELKNRLGLFFLGMVKTAHRHPTLPNFIFAGCIRRNLEIAERSGHFIVVSSKDGVGLRAVAWNDGKRDSKTKKSNSKTNCMHLCVELPYPGEHTESAVGVLILLVMQARNSIASPGLRLLRITLTVRKKLTSIG